MGRPRVNNPHLPQRLCLSNGGYFYTYPEGGKVIWEPLGRDEKFAVEQANKLNRLNKIDRITALGAYRSACTAVRARIFERDEYRCLYCGSTKDLGIDHIIPYVGGGSSLPFNLATSCSTCNAAKGDGDPREFILSLLGLRELILPMVVEELQAKGRITGSEGAEPLVSP